MQRVAQNNNVTSFRVVLVSFQAYRLLDLSVLVGLFVTEKGETCRNEKILKV